MKYVVAHISFHDNDLSTVLVEAENWQQALAQHPAMASWGGEWIAPDDIEDAKIEAFNCDFLFDVVEVP